MIKLALLSDEQVTEISRRIADAFFDYEYNKEDIGLIKFISTRDDMFTYMNAIVRAAYQSGVLYATSEQQEGYLMLSGEGAGGSIGFVDGMRMIMADKKHVSVILDTDDKDKAARYEHLGMKLDRVRSCAERFHMYDLIRE